MNENLNYHRMLPAEVKRRKAEARVLLGFAIEIYRLQLYQGRHFLHEHPLVATSWKESEMKKLRGDSRVGEMVVDFYVSSA